MVTEDQEVGRLLADVHDATAQLGAAREQHREAVLAAMRGGVRQSDLVTVTGWTREYLRRIAREAGIPPARRSGRSAS